MTKRTCNNCGHAMPPNAHHRALYCSSNCRRDGLKKADSVRVRRYQRKRREAEMVKLEKTPPESCAHCARSFTPDLYRHQRYCGLRCRTLALAERKARMAAIQEAKGAPGCECGVCPQCQLYLLFAQSVTRAVPSDDDDEADASP